MQPFAVGHRRALIPAGRSSTGSRPDSERISHLIKMGKIRGRCNQKQGATTGVRSVRDEYINDFNRDMRIKCPNYAGQMPIKYGFV